MRFKGRKTKRKFKNRDSNKDNNLKNINKSRKQSLLVPSRSSITSMFKVFCFCSWKMIPCTFVYQASKP